MIPLPDPLYNIYKDSFTDRRRRWLVLRATNIYRVILGALLLGAFMLDEGNRMFASKNPRLFLVAVLVYLGLLAIAIFASHWRRPRLPVQAHLLMVVDLAVLTIVISTSGGLSSSLNSLLIAAVAASGIVLPLISALLAAALGFFLLIGSWLFENWLEAQSMLRAQHSAASALDNFWSALHSNTNDWLGLGVLGAVLFTAAALTHALAERARSSEALARQRTWEWLEVAELNQGIIHHLQNGVLVVNRHGQVQLINDTAREWLGIPLGSAVHTLEGLAPLLVQGLERWLQDGSADSCSFRPAEYRPELIARFTRLSGRQVTNILILLEDSEQHAAALQQIKLAALGRLTAGIAHEIRNPLTAISHAVQLLEESATGNGERRLAQIAHDNVKRANRIIGDVLDLARRDRVKPEVLLLRSWLDSFAEEFMRSLGHPQLLWEQEVEPPQLTMRFDPHQLRQVLWNLCSNAYQHGAQPGEVPRISIRAGQEEDNYRRPFIEVRDAGAGIAAHNLPRLFEPFFTTNAKGTGLGLYLARELCEANRAQLQYVALATPGCCFRISGVGHAVVEEGA